MTNRHRQKYMVRLLAGLALISGGILVVLYITRLEKEDKAEWIAFAATSLILINSGLFILGNAFVHKVKADLIRKQKQRDQHKKYEFE